MADPSSRGISRIYCSRCGEPNPAEARSCMWCLAPIASSYVPAEPDSILRLPARVHPSSKRDTVHSDSTTQLLAMLGCIALIFGVFTPLVSVPFAGSISYMLNGKGDGWFIIGFAVVGIIMTLAKAYKLLFLPALASLALMGYTFMNLRSGLDNARSASSGGLDFTGLVQFQWGWGVLLIGVVLLIAAALRPAPQQARTSEGIYGQADAGHARSAKSGSSKLALRMVLLSLILVAVALTYSIIKSSLPISPPAAPRTTTESYSNFGVTAQLPEVGWTRKPLNVESGDGELLTSSDKSLVFSVMRVSGLPSTYANLVSYSDGLARTLFDIPYISNGTTFAGRDAYYMEGDGKDEVSEYHHIVYSFFKDRYIYTIIVANKRLPSTAARDLKAKSQAIFASISVR